MHALVYPYLIYGNLMWENTYKTRIQKLMRFQKKIVRLITFKSYSDHTEMIFKNLEILNVYQINGYLTSILMSYIIVMLGHASHACMRPVLIHSEYSLFVSILQFFVCFSSKCQTPYNELFINR